MIALGVFTTTFLALRNKKITTTA